jgi:dynein heavy chain 1, cytosolic
MSFDEFDKATSGCQEVFTTWDDVLKDFTNVAREVTRKRSEKIVPIKIISAHAPLQERIRFVRAFRTQHEQLHETIGRVMRSSHEGEFVSDASAEEEVKMAYESIKYVDILDVSPGNIYSCNSFHPSFFFKENCVYYLEGTEAWVAAENNYNERISRVENQIISKLRDQLGKIKNANEMFRVFSKFNVLFVRPKIRGAIKEYQAQLIDSVKDGIKGLHEKFKMHYRNSESFQLCQVRDIPPTAGSIMWARQIERQLNLYMNRVEQVLGSGYI